MSRRPSTKELQALIPKIELRDPHSIQPNPRNPRRMTEKQFNELVKSLDNFWQMLFLRPIVVDEDGFALGGNRRLLAARKCGFEKVPVIEARLLNEQQKAEFIIKDNTHSGEWDIDALANDWDPKLLNDWGFTVPEFKTQKVSFEAKVKDPTFDITLKADTELDRQRLLTRLTEAGFSPEEYRID
jgi:ParB-like chromosome segregation protein Spo0J